jgi:hypothetical protein
VGGSILAVGVDDAVYLMGSANGTGDPRASIRILPLKKTSINDT